MAMKLICLSRENKDEERILGKEKVVEQLKTFFLGFLVLNLSNVKKMLKIFLNSFKKFETFLNSFKKFETFLNSFEEFETFLNSFEKLEKFLNRLRKLETVL